MTKKILVERWQKLAGILKEETVDEAQFAADPMKNIDTMWQPMGDEDYEPAEGEPMMVGSVQDEEFSLDDFEADEEGLTVREPDWEADPEYAEDELGDLYGMSWEEAEKQHEKDMYQHGRPVIRDTDIGRKS